MLGPFALVVLDMAGTTVRDDGAVDEAFTAALSSVGIGADDPRFASAQAYVRDTMGQSKADVFAALLEPDEATRATEEFARAYERIVAEGRVAPMEGATDVFAALRDDGVQVCLTTGFAPSTATRCSPHWAGRRSWTSRSLRPIAAGGGRRRT